MDNHFVNRNVSGVTTNTGALAIPLEDTPKGIISTQMDINHIGFAFRRDTNYFMCYKTDFSPYTTTQLTIFYLIIK